MDKEFKKIIKVMGWFYLLTFIVFMTLGFLDVILYLSEEFMYWIGAFLMLIAVYLERVITQSNTNANLEGEE